jgi:hemoglobin-like flavoprotein
MQLEDSLREVLAQKELVVEKFYTRFLSENPQVAVFFEGMDMKKQSLMLSAALIVSESHFRENLPAVEFYLQVLGTQHHEARIPKELFPVFRDCLIATISQCQESWSDELADMWRAAIDKAIATMFEGYDEASNAE